MCACVFVIRLRGEISLWGHVRTSVPYICSHADSFWFIFSILLSLTVNTHTHITHTHSIKKRMVPNWIHLKRGHEFPDREREIVHGFQALAIVNVYFSLAIIKNVYSARQLSFEEEKFRLAPNRPKERTQQLSRGKKRLRHFFFHQTFFITLGYFGSQTIFIGYNAYVLRKMPSNWTALDV